MEEHVYYSCIDGTKWAMQHRCNLIEWPFFSCGYALNKREFLTRTVFLIMSCNVTFREKHSFTPGKNGQSGSELFSSYRITSISNESWRAHPSQFLSNAIINRSAGGCDVYFLTASEDAFLYIACSAIWFMVPDNESRCDLCDDAIQRVVTFTTEDGSRQIPRYLRCPVSLCILQFLVWIRGAHHCYSPKSENLDLENFDWRPCGTRFPSTFTVLSLDWR